MKNKNYKPGILRSNKFLHNNGPQIDTTWSYFKDEDLKNKCLFLLLNFVSGEIKENKDDVKSPSKKAATATSGVIDLEVEGKEGEDPIQKLTI